MLRYDFQNIKCRNLKAILCLSLLALQLSLGCIPVFDNEPLIKYKVNKTELIGSWYIKDESGKQVLEITKDDGPGKYKVLYKIQNKTSEFLIDMSIECSSTSYSISANDYLVFQIKSAKYDEHLADLRNPWIDRMIESKKFLLAQFKLDDHNNSLKIYFPNYEKVIAMIKSDGTIGEEKKINEVCSFLCIKLNSEKIDLLLSSDSGKGLFSNNPEKITFLKSKE